jgi:DNA repair exonuclease SbcCD ATPase subunit
MPSFRPLARRSCASATSAAGPSSCRTTRPIDAELIRETDSARTELEQLRAELSETSGEAKANVKKAIKAQQRKLEALDDRIGKTLAQQKAEFEARLAMLREQQAKARESKRQQIEARMAELKASHEARKAKLDEARRHAKESVEATREALKP